MFCRHLIRNCTFGHGLRNWPIGILSDLSSKKSPLSSLHRCYKQNVGTFLSDKQRARDFLTLLNVNEKRILYEELQEQLELVQEPPKIQVIDSTSTANKVEEQSPTINQLRQLFLAQSLPFVGFGFLDNLLMIVAGDYIDLTIGVTLGISTMAAAGLGNALSDVAGIGSAFYVEQMATKIGVRPPKLSLNQLKMARTRWIIQLGRAIGVAVGCIIGMFPLLFLPHREDIQQKDHPKEAH